MQSLVDGVKGATLSGKEEICTGVVGELEVLVVTGLSPPSEAYSGHAILSLAKSGVGVLVQVNFRHDMIAQPRVHDEVAPTMFLNEPNYSV